MSRSMLAVAVAALLALAGWLALAGGGTQAGTINTAGLVIQFPDRTDVHWVEFEEESISGAELLERAGYAVVFSSYGGFGQGVCAIEDVGCQNPGDCFCQCKSGSCSYWAYFRKDGGRWVYQLEGASSRTLRDGDVDAWAWGAGKPPAYTPPDAGCPTPEATPKPAASKPTPVPPSGGGTTGAGTDGSAGAPVGPEGAPNDAPPEQPAVEGAATPTPEAGATPTPGAALGAIDPPDRVPGGGHDSRSGSEAAAGSGGGGVPAGVIAFGAVAGALAATGGGIALRRRRPG